MQSKQPKYKNKSTRSQNKRISLNTSNIIQNGMKSNNKRNIADGDLSNSNYTPLRTSP